MFTGASQFALVSVADNPVAGAASAIMLGTRNAMYGLRLTSILRVRGARKAVAAQLVIDESTAMAIGQSNDDDGRVGFWATGIAVFVFWNLATLIGALGADAIGNPEDFGLDAAAPAAFIALLAPRLRGREPWVVAIAAGVVALMVTPFVPDGVPILLAAVVAVVAGLRSPR